VANEHVHQKLHENNLNKIGYFRPVRYINRYDNTNIIYYCLAILVCMLQIKGEIMISIINEAHLRSKHSQTVEKYPQPSLRMTQYRLLNKSPIRTGRYPPDKNSRSRCQCFTKAKTTGDGRRRRACVLFICERNVAPQTCTVCTVVREKNKLFYSGCGQ